MAEKQAVKAEAGGPAGLHLQGKSSALMRIRNMRTAAKNGGDSAPLKPQKAGITVAELKAESRDPAGRTGLKGSAVKVGTKTVASVAVKIDTERAAMKPGSERATVKPGTECAAVKTGTKLAAVKTGTDFAAVKMNLEGNNLCSRKDCILNLSGISHLKETFGEENSGLVKKKSEEAPSSRGKLPPGVNI